MCSVCGWRKLLGVYIYIVCVGLAGGDMYMLEDIYYVVSAGAYICNFYCVVSVGGGSCWV